MLHFEPYVLLLGNAMKKTPGTVALNRRALHDWNIDSQIEAGLVLEGWEVKSARAAKASVVGSYAILKDGEAWLIGARFEPLPQAAAAIPKPDPVRTRKILLSKRELSKMFGAVARDGMSLVPLNLHWAKGRLKLSLSLAKGRKKHDVREKSRTDDAKREAASQMKQRNRGGGDYS